MLVLRYLLCVCVCEHGIVSVFQSPCMQNGPSIDNLFAVRIVHFMLSSLSTNEAIDLHH